MNRTNQYHPYARREEDREFLALPQEPVLAGFWEGAVIWFIDERGVLHWGSPRVHAEARSKLDAFRRAARDLKLAHANQARNRKAARERGAPAPSCCP